MKACIAAIPSLNICIRAQKVLSESGIFSRIVSVDPKLTRRGCAYGVEFSCESDRDVQSILRRARIRYSTVIESDGGKQI